MISRQAADDVIAALARGELRECACGTVRAVQTMRPSTVTGLYSSTAPQDLQGRPTIGRDRENSYVEQ